jgi:hypothetical protein
MTQPTAPAAGPPAAGEISALIAWLRRLSGLGAHRADPAELAAFLHAKRDLLARIERCSPTTPATPYNQPGDPR